MGIAHTVKDFLDKADVPYRLVPHPRTATSSQTAEAAHIPGDRLAKAVVLDDGESILLAVVPSTHRVDPAELSELLDRRVHLVDEGEIDVVFADCRTGAVPAVGQAYGLETVIEESLVEQPVIYFEAGDHETLVEIARAGFQDLMRGVPRGHFSYHT